MGFIENKDLCGDVVVGMTCSVNGVLRIVAPAIQKTQHIWQTVGVSFAL